MDSKEMVERLKKVIEENKVYAEDIYDNRAHLVVGVELDEDGYVKLLTEVEL